MPATDAPLVFARFAGDLIHSEAGRLLFSIVDAFQRSGLRVHVSSDRPDEGLGKYGSPIFSMSGVSRATAPPADPVNAIYLFDQPDRALSRLPWRKQVQVRFDVFAPYWFSRPVLMPYPLHPNHAGPDLEPRLQRCRRLDKRLRILFAGDTDGYLRNRTHFPDEKMTRTEVIDAVKRGFAERLVLAKEAADLGLAGDHRGPPDRFVVAEARTLRIDPTAWLETVARADFFLCPPGYVMPMCHNIVEAMAVGTIPITNYPEWLNPRLRDGESCIAFRTEDELVARLEEVLAMPEPRIAAMRRRVLDYYERHLTAASFVSQVVGDARRRLTVLMITEANSAKNEHNLHARSVLLRGADEPPSLAWWRSIRSSVARVAGRPPATGCPSGGSR